MALTARCLALGAAATALALAVTYAAGAAFATADLTRVDGAVLAVAAAALAVCATWGWVVCTVAVVQVLRARGRPGRRVRGVPTWVVRLVLAVCGVAAVSAGPAHAQASDGVDGLPYPDRAVGPERPATTAPAPVESRPRPRPVPTPVHVVRPGESLWSISTDRLGAGASAADVAAATAELHDLNRDAVGPDPDLIHPGLRLRTPGPREETR